MATPPNSAYSKVMPAILSERISRPNLVTLICIPHRLVATMPSPATDYSVNCNYLSVLSTSAILFLASPLLAMYGPNPPRSYRNTHSGNEGPENNFPQVFGRQVYNHAGSNKANQAIDCARCWVRASRIAMQQRAYERQPSRCDQSTTVG